MKTLLRTLVFTILAVNFSQYLVNGFDFGQDDVKNFLLISTGIFLLNLISKPIVTMLSLPYQGLGFLIISTFLYAIILYVLTLILPDYGFNTLNLQNLKFVGFMLPSKDLTPILLALLMAFVISLSYRFFIWLTQGKIRG